MTLVWKGAMTLVWEGAMTLVWEGAMTLVWEGACGLSLLCSEAFLTKWFVVDGWFDRLDEANS